MGFLRKPRPNTRPGKIDPAEAAIEQLRHAGADPDAPHETRHFLYVPGIKAAQELARKLQSPDRRVEVETSARKGYWLVAVIQRVVITPPTIAALRTEFEEAARPFGGEYDYWQVDLAAS
jgi:hypothetical protein